MKKNSDSVYARFVTALREKCGISGGRIVVAFSGGPDSLALLHLLSRAREELALELVAVHINHGLRAAAEEDQAFCEQVCRDWNLPLICDTFDTLAEARARKISIETAARDGRYRLLSHYAQAHRAVAIALGHTMNDQAETVLANILRGTGVRGLAGMTWRWNNRIRPLLGFQRDELLNYLQNEGLQWRTDETNESPAYTRNRIRHSLLPKLQEEFNPQIITALAHLAANAAEADEWLRRETGEALQRCLLFSSEKKIVLDIHRFSSYFSSVQKHVVREALERISRGEYRADFTDMQRVQELLSHGRIGKKVSCGKQWEMLLDHGCIVIRSQEQQAFSRRCKRGEKVTIPGIGEVTVSAPMPRTADLHLPPSRFEQLVDADEVKGEIIIRSVLRGDRFHPLGAGGTKTLSNFFTDRKIPLHVRGEIPLITCDAGIIWVVGQQIDDRFKVTTQTTSLLHLAFKEFTL